jgi:hypothetical protein
MLQLRELLKPETLKHPSDRDTLVIAIVEDKSDLGRVLTVYATNNDRTNEELRGAMARLRVERWTSGVERQPRGSIGAPGDAEQIVMNVAEESEQYRLKALVSSREI